MIDIVDTGEGWESSSPIQASYTQGDTTDMFPVPPRMIFQARWLDVFGKIEMLVKPSGLLTRAKFTT